MKRVFFAMMFFTLILSAAALAAGETVWVTGGSLRVRREPSADAQALGSLSAGACIQAEAAGGEWSRVQLGEIEGYVMSAYLSASPAGETPAAKRVASPYGTPTVVLRSRPSNSYGAAGVLQTGTEVTVLGEFDGFFAVDSPAGTGFLAKDEVK